MRRITLLVASLTLMATAALAGWAPSAHADDSGGGGGGGGAVIRTGNCSGTADWTLKARNRNGGWEVEFEVDSNRNGQRWSFALRQNGVVRANGIRTTQAPSGSFSVERRAPNTAGPDTFVGTATNTQTGQSCRGTLTV